MTAPRRRWSFSLRTLLVVIVAITVPMSFFGWHFQIARQRQAGAARLRAIGGSAITLEAIRQFGVSADRPQATMARMRASLFGDGPVWMVSIPEKSFNAEKDWVESLFPEAILQPIPESPPKQYINSTLRGSRYYPDR